MKTVVEPNAENQVPVPESPSAIPGGSLLASVYLAGTHDHHALARVAVAQGLHHFAEVQSEVRTGLVAAGAFGGGCEVSRSVLDYHLTIDTAKNLGIVFLTKISFVGLLRCAVLKKI